jgi:phenylalanyl-tRNA synthetase beta chain
MHVDYPQFIFEIGNCAVKISGSVQNKTKLSGAIIGNEIGYQNISSVLDALLKQLGIKYVFDKSIHSAFIEGRTASIISGKKIGIIGELHPKVINNWGLEKPLAVFEIDLDELYHLYKE